MTIPIAIVLSLLVLAIFFFALEKISVDLITLLLVMTLVVTGILTPAEAFAGFSDEIIIILGSIFTISAALQETGVVEALGARLFRFASQGANRLLLALMVSSSAVSGFMNNTTVTAMLTPPVMVMARTAKISASKLLMPLAFASILGGTCTLIGTSTNVAVSGYLKRAGMEPIGLFEITPMGLVIVAIGLAYLMLIGKHLLPDRDSRSLAERYAIREYLSEIIVMPGSRLVGQRAFESDLSSLDFRILRVIRGSRQIIPNRRAEIQEGDTLVVEGRVENLMKVKKVEGIEIKPEVQLGDLAEGNSELRIAEALIPLKSELVGKSLRTADFRRTYGLTVLAMFRQGLPRRSDLGSTTLRGGDMLLVQGPDENFLRAHAQRDLLVLADVGPRFYDPRKGLYAVLILIAAVIAGGFGLVPLSIAFLGAAVFTVLLKCISIEKAYEFIDWRLLILIGGMTAFGVAMQKTGAANYLADLIVGFSEPFGVMGMLAGFSVLTILLTQPMSNAAAALVVLPVAINAAQKVGAEPRTFAIAVMFAASVSFIAPFEPSCILVYGPGKYRFLDFVKVGLGLTVILATVVLLLLPKFWPLFPVR